MATKTVGLQHWVEAIERDNYPLLEDNRSEGGRKLRKMLGYAKACIDGRVEREPEEPFHDFQRRTDPVAALTNVEEHLLKLR